MDGDTLEEALRSRHPDEPISTAVERWLLPKLREYMSQSGLPSSMGASIESIALDGAYPHTRYVTRFRLVDSRSGEERAVGFTDDVWFTGDDDEVLGGEALIEAALEQPFEILFEGSLWAAVGHLRGRDPLIQRRLERDEATGRNVEWIDFPISDLYSTPELAAVAEWHHSCRDEAVVLSCVQEADRATVVVDGPWNRPRTLVCEQEGGQWRVAETSW